MGGLGLREVFALTPQGAMGMPDAAVRAGRFDRPGTAHEGHGARGSAGHDAMAHGPGRPAGLDADRAAPPAGGAPPGPPSGRRHARDHSLLGADASSGRLAEERSPERPWPPYERLRAVRSTALPEGRPVREVRLTLDGDMERYVWFLDGRELWEDDTIPVRAGEALRFVLVNRTMITTRCTCTGTSSAW